MTPDGAFWTIKFIRKKTSLGRGELRECGALSTPRLID